MTGTILLRALALAVAAALANRGPRALLPVAGLFAGVALLGSGPAALPSRQEAALVAFGLALLFALLLARRWPPLAGAAAETAALFGLPVLAWGVFVLRGHRPADVLLALSGLATVLGIVAAAGVEAAGEAGWRRPALWGLAVLLAGGAGSGLAALAREVLPRQRPFVAAGGFALAVLAFAPVFILEGRRVLLELGEECRLGVLPAEDVECLARPWRRAREPRFGRRDERRTYVRSALLLAVALQQQRRRSGDAVRLRQLEVLTFRTRVRRTLEARNARTGLTDEYSLPA